MHVSSFRFPLAGLLAITLAACSSSQSPVDVKSEAFDDVQAAIEYAVDDPERARQAAALVREIEASFDAALDATIAHKAELRRLNADYDARRDDIDVVFAQMLESTRANQARIIEYRRRLLDVLTPEEWAAIDKARSGAVSAALRALKSA